MSIDHSHEPTAPTATTRTRRTLTIFANTFVVALLLGIIGCAGPTGMHPDVERPHPSEFGPSERASNNGLYRAELDVPESLNVGPMYQMTLRIRQSSGGALDSATISVGGGMPEHGHGLPTAPKATAESAGVYRVDGVRFNMGGWWVLSFVIEGAHGTDTVAFNFDI